MKHGKGSKSLSDAEFQMKMRTNRLTDKQQVLEILNTCFAKSKSKDDFFLKLNERGLTTYIRSGKLTGILFQNKKHRLARLGYNENILNELDKSFARNQDLHDIRKQSKEKTINKDNKLSR